jgi:hypothetical protein
MSLHRPEERPFRVDLERLIGFQTTKSADAGVDGADDSVEGTWVAVQGRAAF